MRPIGRVKGAHRRVLLLFSSRSRSEFFTSSHHHDHSLSFGGQIFPRGCCSTVQPCQITCTPYDICTPHPGAYIDVVGGAHPLGPPPPWRQLPSRRRRSARLHSRKPQRLSAHDPSRSPSRSPTKQPAMMDPAAQTSLSYPRTHKRVSAVYRKSWS